MIDRRAETAGLTARERLEWWEARKSGRRREARARRDAHQAEANRLRSVMLSSPSESETMRARARRDATYWETERDRLALLGFGREYPRS